MAAHDRKWHITQDRTDREKRRKWKRSGRERNEKSEKSEKKERVRPEERWSLSRWLCGGRCCEVSTAADKERIEEERRQKERKEERRAKRREEKQKQRERDEWRRQHNDRGREDIGQAKSNTDADHTANRLRLRSSSRLLDDESDGSGSARSGYSGISRASSFASSCASGTSERRSEREPAPGRRRSEVKESRRSRREDPIPSPSTVKDRFPQTQQFWCRHGLQKGARLPRWTVASCCACCLLWPPVDVCLASKRWQRSGEPCLATCATRCFAIGASRSRSWPQPSCFEYPASSWPELPSTTYCTWGGKGREDYVRSTGSFKRFRLSDGA
eukprot:symbB.v1.2.008333.t1/scaffold507.1/size305965/3